MSNQVYVIINKATGELWSCRRGKGFVTKAPQNAWPTTSAAKTRFSYSEGIKFDSQEEYEMVELMQYYIVHELTEQAQQLNMGY